jgi:hypothetical protein
VVGHDGQELAAAPVGDLVDPDAVEVVQPGIVDVVDQTRATIASTASQEQRSSLPMLVLSIRCANQATTFSKSLLCRAFGRAHGICSVRTRLQVRQSMRWMSASSHTRQAPKSRCRHWRRDES